MAVDHLHQGISRRRLVCSHPVVHVLQRCLSIAEIPPIILCRRQEKSVPKVHTSDLISISEAARMGISGLVREAEAGREQVVLRNNKPVAAIVSMQRLEELERLEEDLADVSLVIARMLTTSEQRHSLDDVLAQFGYTREQIEQLPE
jgi:prevent-host-death family protein